MPSVATDPHRVEPRPVVWRLTGRPAFAALRSYGTRASAHGVSVTFLAAPSDASTPPRAAFAVTRRAGGAVERNRIRRRLRAGLRALAAAGGLPPGDYLVGAGAAVGQRPWAEVAAALDEAVTRATTGRR